ncbi:hypothetical protein SKAU_G00299470 [Synaphobranchus kaupii]|uniref:Uncharacterized protein n=1 Tax=Synaphobranchus kaupii TaxID=118154 RepID=A0A9Q1EVG5_SYNKA|nr:hypothetical protein SKAU_G00299470 [Synaphobranchus kaupii]
MRSTRLMQQLLEGIRAAFPASHSGALQKIFRLGMITVTHSPFNRATVPYRPDRDCTLPFNIPLLTAMLLPAGLQEGAEPGTELWSHTQVTVLRSKRFSVLCQRRSRPRLDPHGRRAISRNARGLRGAVANQPLPPHQVSPPCSSQRVLGWVKTGALARWFREQASGQ